MNEIDDRFLRRARWLAQLGSPAKVEPNPPVGALLVKDGCILAEGYHRRYGGPHAEIEALRAVPDSNLIHGATLYVTLEPCCYYGKTPPCTSAIIEAGLSRVVVGTPDPNPKVAGAGLRQLAAAGLTVTVAPDPHPYQRLLRHFLVNLTEHRPYITLKWAQLKQPHQPPILGSRLSPRYPISTFWAKVWGHRLRAKHSHIAVGYATWQLDKPLLSTRYYPGDNPKPIVFYDPRRGEPAKGLYASAAPLFVPLYPLRETLAHLYEQHQVGSILIEGGAQVLETFLGAALYDEIHILTRYEKAHVSPSQPVWAPYPPRLPWRTYRLAPAEILRFYRRPLIN